ncbi:hypothetical protein [Flavobacterium sp.]|uniref:hypothetical protein n=1 Tax=Flavobacterium sp. TaxID=239 RepID=UPI003526EE59
MNNNKTAALILSLFTFWSASFVLNTCSKALNDIEVFSISNHNHNSSYFSQLTFSQAVSVIDVEVESSELSSLEKGSSITQSLFFKKYLVTLPLFLLENQCNKSIRNNSNKNYCLKNPIYEVFCVYRI